MNSFNHYAYGAVGSFLFETVAGINPDPTITGFKRILLAPIPDERLSIAASYESAYGRIEASSKIQNGVWTYHCTLPANTTAEIRIPSENANCTVNGKAVTELTLDTDGIRLMANDGGTLVFEAVSGSFSFTVTLS